MATTPADRFSWRRLSEWAASGPVHEVEDSLPFRVLVQLLVFIGIAATDQVSEKGFSLWAIPLSAMGAGWGWYARRKRNIPVKILIALAMVGALFSFLSDLVSSSDETRLLLSRLLIQLQVLHSFDLPRRRDLGYSIVIGFILLGVAGTISQTLIYGLWILAFLAVVIPVLVLDLRSRLKIDTRTWKPQQLGIPPLTIATLLGVVVVIGLVIFALLPRLPGYQLRNFPVSNAVIERQVPSGAIIRPGNTGQAQADGSSGGAGSGQGENGENGEKGNTGLPPLFGEQFDATKSAEVEPSLILRVRSQAPLFWRVLAYDRYTGRGWQISRTDKSFIRTLQREPYNYKFEVPVTLGFGSRSGPKEEIIQTYTVTTEYFPNLIPAAAEPSVLYFPSEELDVDPEGNLRAPGILPLDLTYTVVSSVSRREPVLLRAAGTKYPRAIRRFYLEVPDQLLPSLQSQTLALLSEARTVATGEPQSIDNPYDAALYLTQWLKQQYRLGEISFNDTDDVVSRFLEAKTGSPTHFVSTLVMMLRSLGIPTRYTVGFAPGRFNPFTGYYEVMNTDTLSLAEVFFPGYGWFAFNPVPGQPLFPPSLEEDQTFSALSSFWKWLAGFLPSPIVGFFAVLFDAIGKGLSSIATAVATWLTSLGWLGIFAGILLGVVLGLVLWGGWQLLGWWGFRLRMATLHPMQRLYQQMLYKLAEQGLNKPPATTPLEFAHFVTSRSPAPLATIVWEITHAYQDWRYGNVINQSLSHLRRSLRRLEQRDWRKMSYTEPNS